VNLSVVVLWRRADSRFRTRDGDWSMRS
jgi:hypothetical protein